jgi:hypothetical protein
MPRPSTTPKQRADATRVATIGLADAIAYATETLRDYGPNDSHTRDAWEAVEKRGAIIHRQARLLAGKSKGG